MSKKTKTQEQNELLAQQDQKEAVEFLKEYQEWVKDKNFDFAAVLDVTQLGIKPKVILVKRQHDEDKGGKIESA